MLGTLNDFHVSDVSQELREVLGVDPLDANAVAGIGIDLDGNAVVFSEDVNPTFVVHLRSAEQMNGFLDGIKQGGVRTQSVLWGGTEVFSAKVSSDLTIGWAVEKEWLWVHFCFNKADGFDWFEHSKQPAYVGWLDAWTWASEAAGAAPVSGVVDLQAIVANIGHLTREPEPIACAKQLLALERIGVGIDADLQHVSARLAFDLGAAADGMRAAILAPPPGWATASTGAPLAAQWNIDALAAAAWLEPCIGDDDLSLEIGEYGVRSIRAFVRELDPDDKDGVGAVSADLASNTFFKEQLDKLPGRSAFESSRKFGAYDGRHLKVPMVVTADYVLTDKLLIAAMGDKVLETIGSGTAAPGPAFELAVRPPGLSENVWRFLFDAIDVDNPKRAAQRLLLWRELSISGRLDGSTLAVTAQAVRR
jgi:hypothetical protein